jgi:HK97 family phage portal protein
MFLSTLASVVMAALPGLRRPSAAVSTGPFGGGGAQVATTYTAASRAYSSNEIIFGAVDQLATSAAEPHIGGRRYRRARAQVRTQAKFWQACGIRNRPNAMMLDAMLVRNGFTEELPDHPLVKLLNNPNPFTSRGLFWSTAIMDYYLAGNWFALKVRDSLGLGVVLELWRLRPDRVKPIPGDMSKGEPFIKEYEYRPNGGELVTYKSEDIIHIRARNPQDIFLGQAAITPVMPWVMIDEVMRRFLSDFFTKGGVGPAAILTVAGEMAQSDKDRIRNRLSAQFGSVGNWFETIILDQTEASYTKLGLERGLRDAVPKDISDMVASRIIVALHIPADVFGLDSQNTSYASRRVSWSIFWDMTMTPLLSDFADGLNLSITPDFGGIDEVFFDMTDIRALQEDIDAIHERTRRNFAAGLTGWGRARQLIGEDPEADPDDIVFVPATAIPMKAGDLGQPLPPQQVASRMMFASMETKRIGRPRIEDDDEARGIWEEAKELRETGLTWKAIAGRLNVVERQLYRYQDAFESD